MEKISFQSHGQNISGCLYKPNNFVEDQKYPTIILCHGFAGVKELLLPAYAESFSKDGFIVLTFDYRGFGESEGEPGRLVPKLQVEDILSVIDYIIGLSYVGKIALWGTSYGGANAIIAASISDKISAVSAQLTFGNGMRVVTGNMSVEEKDKFLTSIEKMLDKREKTGKELMMPLGKVLSDDQSQKFYKRYCEDFDALKIKIPFLTVNETMHHIPEDSIGKLNIPVLIVGSEKDSVNPPQESRILFQKANEPKELLMLDDAEHYECYEGEAFDKVIKKQKEFFNHYIV